MPSDSFIIRKATPFDTDGIAALIIPIQQQEFGIEITFQDQPDLKDIANFYQGGTGGFWVAETLKKIAGTIGLKDIGNQEAALRKMFVHPDYRGKPHLTAQKLLTHLLDHAQKQNIKTIYLGTTAKFLAAHRFYEKNGFELIDAETLPDSFPRMNVDTRFYRIRI